VRDATETPDVEVTVEEPGPAPASGEMVPFRATVEALGFGDTIRWESGTITVSNGTETITFGIGDSSINVSSQTTALVEAITLSDGRTFVPQQLIDLIFGQVG